jgi:hypothetical protein
MKIINIDQDYVISLISNEDTYFIIPELNFLEKYKDKFKKVKDGDVSCGPCVQNGLINPVSLQLMMFIFENNNKNNSIFLENIKQWTKKYFSIDEEFKLKFSYQEHSLSEVVDVFI